MKMEILDKVGNVFEIEKVGDKFVLTECCDNWFSVELTKEELAQLGRELIEISGFSN